MTFFTGYLALGVGNNRFVETGDAGYQRASVSIVSVGAGGFALIGSVTNGSQTLGTQLAVYDAPSGGNLIMWWRLPSPVLFASAYSNLSGFSRPSLFIPSLEGQLGTPATAQSFAQGQIIGTASDGTPVVAGVNLSITAGVLSGPSSITIGSSSPTSGLVAAPAISASGSNQTLTFQATQTIYDITLSANCLLSVIAAGALAGQSIIVILRGPYTWTPPANVGWPNGSPPQPQCSAKAYDAIQFTVLEDGTLEGSVIGLGNFYSSLTLTAFSGSIYSTGTLSVSGTYTGVTPANLDYSVDGGAYTTLTSGAATITNGTFSFSLASPPSTVGSHTLSVRATGTTEVSANQAFSIAAPVAPTNPTLSVAGGNAQSTLTMSANPNGAAVTQFTVYRGTSAGGESGTALATVSATNNAATYTDTGLTNGTAYYYKMAATNSVGTSSSSAEATVTPVATITHYLNATSTANSTTSKAEGITDGYLDIKTYQSFPNLSTACSLFSKWTNSGSSGGNSEYLFQLNSSGGLFLAICNGSGSIATFSSTSSAPATVNTPIWARAQINFGSATNNGIPAGNIVFSTSPDGTSWTQLGSNITNGSTNGIVSLSAAASPTYVGSIATNGNTGTMKFFKAIVTNSAGTILYNPDFTAQATGTTSFVDTAATPNTWAVTSGAQV